VKDNGTIGEKDQYLQLGGSSGLCRAAGEALGRPLQIEFGDQG
jgi:hypothetical protein